MLLWAVGCRLLAVAAVHLTETCNNIRYAPPRMQLSSVKGEHNKRLFTDVYDNNTNVCMLSKKNVTIALRIVPNADTSVSRLTLPANCHCCCVCLLVLLVLLASV